MPALHSIDLVNAECLLPTTARAGFSFLSLQRFANLAVSAKQIRCKLCKDAVNQYQRVCEFCNFKLKRRWQFQYHALVKCTGEDALQQISHQFGNVKFVVFTTEFVLFVFVLWTAQRFSQLCLLFSTFSVLLKVCLRWRKHSFL